MERQKINCLGGDLKGLRAFTVAAFLSYCLFGVAQKTTHAQTDPRLQPITQAEIKKIAETMPLNSSQHFHALSRAYQSGRPTSRFAYGEYKSLLSKRKDDPQATLLAAVATLSYYQKLDNTRPKGAQDNYQPFLDETGALFRRAMFLDPNAPNTVKNYGNYMFHHDYNQGKQIGMNSLLRAENMNPKDAGVHAVLGDIYANPFNGGYKPEKAEDELLKSIALDPTWAYPRDRLIGLYLWQKKPAKVREQVAAYRKLLPNPEKSEPYLSGILKQCAKMEASPVAANH